MNRSRLWCVPLAWLIVASVTAAPVPEGVPASQGPITDYLRQRGTLPATEAPVAMKAVLRGDAIEVNRLDTVYRYETRARNVKVAMMVPVLEERERTVRRDGRDVKEKYTVTLTKTVEREVVQTVTVAVPVTVPRRTTAAVKDCKFFTVTRAGRLEKIAADKATALLAKAAAILTGPTATIDPRYLERIKPGTLYVILGTGAPMLVPPPEKVPQRDEKRPR